MSNQDIVRNLAKNTWGTSKHAIKPRDSEYNLPTLLTDISRDPPRNFQRGNLLGTGGFAKVFLVKDEVTSKSFAFADKVTFHRFFEDSYIHILLELAFQKTLLHVNSQGPKETGRQEGGEEG